MTHAALSVFVFGIYMLGQGALLIIAPNLILLPFGLPPAADVWIRVVGLCLVVFSYYYMRAARAELTEFFGWTVHMRVFQFLVFGGLVLTGMMQTIGILFSLVEMAAGLWTFFALRSDRGNTGTGKTVHPDATGSSAEVTGSRLSRAMVATGLIAILSVFSSCSGDAVIGQPAIADSKAREAMGSKKALIIISSHEQYDGHDEKTGYWLSEVTHFYHVLAMHGIKMDIASPEGRPGVMDPRSNDMDDPLNATFWSDPELRSLLEKPLDARNLKAEDYGLIYFAGGHGTMWDFTESDPLAKLAAGIYESDGIVSAVCHGPAGLVNIKLSNGSYLIEGRKVTGFANAEEWLIGKTDMVPYLLEDKLIERGGDYSESFIPFRPYAVADGRLVTGQNPFSTTSVAEAVIAVLEGQ